MYCRRRTNVYTISMCVRIMCIHAYCEVVLDAETDEGAIVYYQKNIIVTWCNKILILIIHVLLFVGG